MFSLGNFISRQLAGKPEQSMHAKQLTSSEIARLSSTAAAEFQREYREIFSAFDSDQLGQTLATYLQVKGFHDIEQLNEAASTGDSTEFIALMVKELSRAFVLLYQNPRSAVHKIQLVSTMPAEAVEDWFRLIRSVQNSELEPVAEAAVVPSAPPLDPRAECKRDFREMGSSEFQTKWLRNTNRRPVYESLIERGEI